MRSTLHEEAFLHNTLLITLHYDFGMKYPKLSMFSAIMTFLHIYIIELFKYYCKPDVIIALKTAKYWVFYFIKRFAYQLKAIDTNSSLTRSERVTDGSKLTTTTFHFNKEICPISYGLKLFTMGMMHNMSVSQLCHNYEDFLKHQLGAEECKLKTTTVKNYNELSLKI